MQEFVKEVANLEKLRGHSNIVQIRDHTLHPRTGHVVILMELAACDLATFFTRSGYSFDVTGMLSIWRSLVNAVGAAHTQDIIHRDLKPQNFLLVPIAPPFADRILATTTVPSKDFKFRIVNRAAADDSEKGGDVELTLTDSATGVSQVLQLIIKVSDFGLAQPLDLDADADASHLSVRGHAGTIKYMAPEAFQASEDAVQRLTKRVDIWALGIILFQMLHGGRTPFDRYCSPGNNIRAAVAIASPDIHAKVMKFERQSVWATERKSLQRDFRPPGSTDPAANVCQSVTAKSLLSTEFLFRMCENCLAFEAPDRVLAGDLKAWVGHLLDSEWWGQTMRSLSEAGAVQDLLSGVSEVSAEDDTASQLDNLNLVEQGGDRIERVFFRELRRAATPAIVGTNGMLLTATGSIFALKDAPRAFREDKGVVLAAVKNYGWALQFASETLQNDKEVILAAVQNDGTVLVLAWTKLWKELPVGYDEYSEQDTEIVREALRNIENEKTRKQVWQRRVPVQLQKKVLGENPDLFPAALVVSNGSSIEGTVEKKPVEISISSTVPSPTAVPSPTPSPAAVPSPAPSPTAVPSPTAAPSATAVPSPTPSPTAAPSPTAVPSPTPSPTAVPSPTASSPRLSEGARGGGPVQASGVSASMVPAAWTIWVPAEEEGVEDRRQSGGDLRRAASPQHANDGLPGTDGLQTHR